MELEKPKKTSDRAYYLFALRIVGDFGASIAVPVVLFVLLGQYLDKRWHSGPFLTILGFVVAALISGRIIYRKAKLYGEEYQKLNKRDT